MWGTAKKKKNEFHCGLASWWSTAFKSLSLFKIRETKTRHMWPNPAVSTFPPWEKNETEFRILNFLWINMNQLVQSVATGSVDTSSESSLKPIPKRLSSNQRQLLQAVNWWWFMWPKPQNLHDMHRSWSNQQKHDTETHNKYAYTWKHNMEYNICIAIVCRKCVYVDHICSQTHPRFPRSTFCILVTHTHTQGNPNKPVAAA